MKAVGTAPSGAAGGDLAGNYPNPTVAQSTGLALYPGPSANTDFMRNGTNAQTLAVAGTYTDANNWEILKFSFGGGAFNITADATGTGLYRPLGFYVGNTLRWQIGTNGTLGPGFDNLWDIGTSTLRVRSLYSAGPDSKGSAIVTAATTLSSTGAYRTIVNSASAVTITANPSPLRDETRVVTNVGAGTVTVSYVGRTGATTRAIAQDAAVTFAYNATLGYWTTE